MWAGPFSNVTTILFIYGEKNLLHLKDKCKQNKSRTELLGSPSQSHSYLRPVFANCHSNFFSCFLHLSLGFVKHLNKPFGDAIVVNKVLCKVVDHVTLDEDFVLSFFTWKIVINETTRDTVSSLYLNSSHILDNLINMLTKLAITWWRHTNSADIRTTKYCYEPVRKSPTNLFKHVRVDACTGAWTQVDVYGCGWMMETYVNLPESQTSFYCTNLNWKVLLFF